MGSGRPTTAPDLESPRCRACAQTLEGTRIAFRLARVDKDNASELVRRLVG